MLHASSAALEQTIADMKLAATTHVPASSLDESSLSNSDLPDWLDLQPNDPFGDMRIATPHPQYSALDFQTTHAIIPSAWPQTLPSLALVNLLVETFFSNHSLLVSNMIHRPRLLAKLRLPPSHPEFPITPLLHAIIAVASTLVSTDVWDSEIQMWSSDETPSEWHHQQAKLGIEIFWNSSDPNYLQVGQAAVICCFTSYSAARYKEGWLMSAQAIRLLVPIGLNHVRSTGARGEYIDDIRPSMLAPTNEDDLLYERSATFYLAFAVERFACAHTGWASCIKESDITTLLPGPPGFQYPVSKIAIVPAATYSCLSVRSRISSTVHSRCTTHTSPPCIRRIKFKLSSWPSKRSF